MTNPLPDLVAESVAALTGERWAIDHAADHVPARPGLYAIYGDTTAWNDLRLAQRSPEGPLYVGKAERSLESRDLNGHFAIKPGSIARTGSSTVRRSFAALLRGQLGLRAVPRSFANPTHFANYALAEGGDERLSQWMHARLALSVWPAPSAAAFSLGEIETSVITIFTPPINIAKNPGKLAQLSQARAVMATEASNWRFDS